MNILSKISEYFLGTETRKWERENRAFYREYFEDEKTLKSLLKCSEASERYTLYLRWIPNLLTAGGVTYLLLTNSPIWLFLGEPLRVVTMISDRKHKRDMEMKKNAVKREWGLLNIYSDLADKITRIENEGEEWKNRN